MNTIYDTLHLKKPETPLVRRAIAAAVAGGLTVTAILGVKELADHTHSPGTIVNTQIHENGQVTPDGRPNVQHPNDAEITNGAITGQAWVEGK